MFLYLLPRKNAPILHFTVGGGNSQATDSLHPLQTLQAFRAPAECAESPLSAECPRNPFGGRSLGDPPKRNAAPSGVGSGVVILTRNESCNDASYTPPGRSQALSVELVARVVPGKRRWYVYDVLLEGDLIVTAVARSRD